MCWESTSWRRGDAATKKSRWWRWRGDKKFLMVTVTRHHINLSVDGDTGVFPSSFLDILHFIWILYLGAAVTRRQKSPVGDGDAAPKNSCWWRWRGDKNILMVTVTRHQESLSGDGDMGVLPSFIANIHYVGILYLGDTVTRRQKRFWWWRWRGDKINPDGDGDAAPEIFWWWRWQQTYTMLGFYILATRWHGDMEQQFILSIQKYFIWKCINIYVYVLDVLYNFEKYLNNYHGIHLLHKYINSYLKFCKLNMTTVKQCVITANFDSSDMMIKSFHKWLAVMCFNEHQQFIKMIIIIIHF